MGIIHVKHPKRRPRAQFRYVRLRRKGYVCLDCDEPIIRDRKEDTYFCQVCGEKYTREEFKGVLTRNLLILHNRSQMSRKKFQESHRLHKIALQRKIMDVVYYLRFGDRIKIGTTRDPQRRMASLPWDEILAMEPGGAALEARRHKQFAEHRINGEWFHISEDLLQHIDTVREDHAEHMVKRFKGKPEFPWGKGVGFDDKFTIAHNLLSDVVEPMPFFEDDFGTSGPDERDLV